ncbi:MAG: hypothetical protein JSU77_12785, partial [Fidelibacterota bacterium]
MVLFRSAYRFRILRKLPLLIPVTFVLLSCELFDIFPPEIEIISPEDNASCIGMLSCEIEATDNQGVTKVEVYLDNVSIHEFTDTPYKATMDISGQSSGTKALKAIAYDKAGNHAQAEHLVRIVKETVSTPSAPIGPGSGNIGVSYTYSTSGASSSIGHNLEYRFDWDDGTYSSWSPSNSASHTWSAVRNYYIRAQARCGTDTSVVSSWSGLKTVIIREPIVVTTPTSSTVWTQGQQNVTISWNTGNIGGYVQIRLYKGSTSVATITSSTSNDGTYATWDVPASQTPGTDYRVRVYYNADNYDYSDYFAIVGNIAVTEPASSTVWSQGQQNVTISWDTGNLGGSVQIRLYKGSSSVATIASSTTNDGSYTTWDVPSNQTQGTDYRVRIYYDTDHYDYSDYFTIAGSIVVTEPTSSTVWAQGQQNVTISWDTGNLGGYVQISLYKGSSSVAAIASSTGNDGSYTLWDVPSNQTQGTDYRVRVYYDASHYDYSDYFMIASPVVVSNPDPADGATVAPGASGQLLRVTAPGATSGTIYYDDDSSISYSVAATINGDYLEATIPYASGQITDNGTNYWYVEATNAAGTTRYPSSGNLTFTVTTVAAPIVSNPDPADGATVAPGASGQLLRVTAPGATSGTFYYDDDSGIIDYSVAATVSGDYLEVTIPYASGQMTDNGTNYWYVEATNAAGTTRYPSSGHLTFTVTTVAAPVVSNPEPADGATVTPGASGQLLRVMAPGATSGTIYYDDDSGISYSAAATVSGDYLEVTIPYASGQMTDNGTNYWYVEATNAAGTTRYPSSGNLYFMV